MPGLDGPFSVWPQTTGATMTQHMEISNSFLILISPPFEEFVNQLYSFGFASSVNCEGPMGSYRAPPRRLVDLRKTKTNLDRH
jgi:hypothetical protein